MIGRDRVACIGGMHAIQGEEAAEKLGIQLFRNVLDNQSGPGGLQPVEQFLVVFFEIVNRRVGAGAAARGIAEDIVVADPHKDKCGLQGFGLFDLAPGGSGQQAGKAQHDGGHWIVLGRSAVQSIVNRMAVDGQVGGLLQDIDSTPQAIKILYSSGFPNCRPSFLCNLGVKTTH